MPGWCRAQLPVNCTSLDRLLRWGGKKMIER